MHETFLARNDKTPNTCPDATRQKMKYDPVEDGPS